MESMPLCVIIWNSAPGNFHKLVLNLEFITLLGYELGGFTPRNDRRLSDFSGAKPSAFQ